MLDLGRDERRVRSVVLVFVSVVAVVVVAAVCCLIDAASPVLSGARLVGGVEAPEAAREWLASPVGAMTWMLDNVDAAEIDEGEREMLLLVTMFAVIFPLSKL